LSIVDEAGLAVGVGWFVVIGSSVGEGVRQDTAASAHKSTVASRNDKGARNLFIWFLNCSLVSRGIKKGGLMRIKLAYSLHPA
jgi:hypothetical protein